MTTEPRTLPDPTDLDALRHALDTGPGDRSRRRPIGLRQIVIAPDALDLLPRAVLEARGDRDGPVVLLHDATPMRRGDDDLKALVARGLGAALQDSGVALTVFVLGANRPELHADETALAEADVAIAGASCVVTLGSGTVTDIGKDATCRAGIPFVVVQTAVSVNAFSDDLAVLLRSGVKRTVPSHWPKALFIDLDVIAGAPPRLNQAGYGELLTMFTAPADWYLATTVGADDSYDPGTVALYRSRADRLLANAGGVARSDSEALAELACQMTLTGLAMGVAGRTAPLSGTEHTISHLLDMAGSRQGRPVGLHGAQVGVAAIVAALAWRRVLRDLDPAELPATGDGEASATRRTAHERRVHAAFDWLDDTGAAAAECWRDVARKLDRWAASTARVRDAAAAWDRHRAAISELLGDPAELVAALRAAGAPTRFSELDPAPGPDIVRWAVASCHLMRDRFTVADLIELGGLPYRWDEAFADDILSEAGLLGAGW